MFAKNTEKNTFWRDLIRFPVAYNVVGFVIVTMLYAISPESLSRAETQNTMLYTGVLLTHWSLAYVMIKRLGISGLKRLIVPRERPSWSPSILVFVSLNVLFAGYMVLALRYGRIPPWGSLNFLQIVFFTVLNPITAGFVEELIWRGYFIEMLLAAGKTEWRAIVYSSLSFALIHGLIIVDKLIVTFLFGVIAGTYYVRERNLPVLMVTHVTVDVVSFGLLVFRLV